MHCSAKQYMQGEVHVTLRLVLQSMSHIQPPACHTKYCHLLAEPVQLNTCMGAHACVYTSCVHRHPRCKGPIHLLTVHTWKTGAVVLPHGLTKTHSALSPLYRGPVHTPYTPGATHQSPGVTCRHLSQDSICRSVDSACHVSLVTPKVTLPCLFVSRCLPTMASCTGTFSSHHIQKKHI